MHLPLLRLLLLLPLINLLLSLLLLLLHLPYVPLVYLRDTHYTPWRRPHLAPPLSTLRAATPLFFFLPLTLDDPSPNEHRPPSQVEYHLLCLLLCFVIDDDPPSLLIPGDQVLALRVVCKGKEIAVFFILGLGGSFHLRNQPFIDVNLVIVFFNR